MVREIRKLERQGYIIREKDPKDERIYRVYLAKKAEKIKSIVKKEAHEWQRILLKGFTKEERKFIMKLLEKIAQNAISANKENNCDGYKSN